MLSTRFNVENLIHQRYKTSYKNVSYIEILLLFFSLALLEILSPIVYCACFTFYAESWVKSDKRPREHILSHSLHLRMTIDKGRGFSYMRLSELSSLTFAPSCHLSHFLFYPPSSTLSVRQKPEPPKLLASFPPNNSIVHTTHVALFYFFQYFLSHIIW